MSDKIKHNLTARQKEVMYWTMLGKSYTSIGIILGISPHTVLFHRKEVAVKYNLPIITICCLLARDGVIDMSKEGILSY